MNQELAAPAIQNVDRIKSAPFGEGVRLRSARLANRHLIGCVALLFVLPNVIFASALTLLPALALLFGCALAGVLIWRAAPGELLAKPVEAKVFVGCLALAFVICLLGGETHAFYATYDWIIRDAVLADLVQHGTINVYAIEGQKFLMRAPLGMYLAPAMVGRAFGLVAAHRALLIQNATLLAIVLYFVAQLASTRKMATIIIFVLFSGVDLLPSIILNAPRIWRTGHVQFEYQLDWWARLFQYPGHLLQMFWAPHHTLPAWWFAVLALLYVRREVSLPLLVAFFAPLVLWSPLAMLGAAPFLLLFGLSRAPSELLSRDFLCALLAGAAFLPVALYLALDGGEVPHELLLLHSGFVVLWAAFMLVEIPHAGIIAWQRHLVEACDRPILLTAVAVLALIPIYAFGENNDFAMRSSSVSLFLLAFAFSRVAVLTPRDGGRAATAISTIVILSAAAPIIEIRHALEEPAFPISDCNFTTAWVQSETYLPRHYLARLEKAPGWLKTTEGEAIQAEPRKCRPDDVQRAEP